MKNSAINLIKAALNLPSVKPAVLWSSGKDSMALLHLVRQVSTDVPVVMFREPWQPSRYNFANKIIEDWRLNEVHDMTPVSSFVCSRNGATSVIHRFQFGDKGIDLPVDFEEIDGERWACGIDVMFRPKASYVSNFNLVFSGARSADRDQLLGHMPIASDVIRQHGAPTLVLPMREWSDEDTWRYIEDEKVPVQTDRYAKVDGQWMEVSRRNNPDYLAGCVRCLSKDAADSVYCPKINAHVNGMRGCVQRIDNPLPFYIQGN